MLAKARVYKLAAALVIVLPVTIVWSPKVLLALREIGGSLVDEAIHARSSVLDTAAYFLWAIFGLLGVVGLWLWVAVSLNSRRQRIVTAAFVLLGVIAAFPWAVAGVRQQFWPGLLLVAACLLGLAVTVTLLRPNSMPPTDARASEVLNQPPSARPGERGR
jgi:hypothetical protein